MRGTILCEKKLDVQAPCVISDIGECVTGKSRGDDGKYGTCCALIFTRLLIVA